MVPFIVLHGYCSFLSGCHWDLDLLNCSTCLSSLPNLDKSSFLSRLRKCTRLPGLLLALWPSRLQPQNGKRGLDVTKIREFRVLTPIVCLSSAFCYLWWRVLGCYNQSLSAHRRSETMPRLAKNGTQGFLAGASCKTIESPIPSPSAPLESR